MTAVPPITAARLAELMADIRPDGDDISRRPRPGCIEGAIGNAVQAAHYQQERGEPDPLHVAAYLLRSLARNHCYEDGNKRIAWVAALDVLWAGASLTVVADQEVAADVVCRVATGEFGVDEIVAWLAEHLVAV